MKDATPDLEKATCNARRLVPEDEFAIAEAFTELCRENCQNMNTGFDRSIVMSESQDKRSFGGGSLRTVTYWGPKHLTASEYFQKPV